MYDELFKEIMRKMGNTNAGFSKTLHKRNIDNFLSVCLMEEINTFVIEEMAISHSKFTSNDIITKLENMLEGAPKEIRPIERDGIVYDSMRDMARELGVSLSTVQYQVKKGIARRIEDV